MASQPIVQFKNQQVYISSCRIGTVVSGVVYGPTMFGHIEGFSVNALGELVIRVKFADGKVRERHPSNLNIYI